MQAVLWGPHLGSRLDSGPGMARHLVVIRAGHMRGSRDRHFLSTRPLPSYTVSFLKSYSVPRASVCPEG